MLAENEAIVLIEIIERTKLYGTAILQNEKEMSFLNFREKS